GSVTLRTGCADMGQGSSTVLAQMVAEELGVPGEAVRVISADTAATPDAGPSTASRQTFTSGNAVLSAAREVKESLLGLASQALEASPEDLSLK
ncbi:MAG: molybdopterin-dependent oxidoreductase, partial [Thermoplasmata archaeon]|nr:molybdopterin-dependent oxidoreductase [Thermoplasmata archaeon]NIY05043.1 molybdopterin-dependent oxidoreductase [Thermoplasmata archaeon]